MNIKKNILLTTVVGVVGLIAGLMIGILLIRVEQNSVGTKKVMVRDKFMKNHEYRRSMSHKLNLRVRHVSDKLEKLSKDSTTKQMPDSIRSLLQQSIVVLLKCDKFDYELEILDKSDSILFEMYGN